MFLLPIDSPSRRSSGPRGLFGALAQELQEPPRRFFAGLLLPGEARIRLTHQLLLAGSPSLLEVRGLVAPRGYLPAGYLEVELDPVSGLTQPEGLDGHLVAREEELGPVREVTGVLVELKDPGLGGERAHHRIAASLGS